MSEVRDRQTGGRPDANGSWFSGGLKRAAVYAGVAVLIFLAGFVPVWLRANSRAEERDEARRELRLAYTENLLGFAAVSARRGDYEPARQAASDFFTALRRETDEKDDAALTPAERDGLKPLLEQRDEVITLLARGDPASAERLSDLYVAYRGVMHEGRRQNEQVRTG